MSSIFVCSHTAYSEINVEGKPIKPLGKSCLHLFHENVSKYSIHKKSVLLIFRGGLKKWVLHGSIYNKASCKNLDKFFI